MGRAKRSGELVLVGGNKAHMRKPGKREWTIAREDAFLSALEATCNVTLAAEETGVSVSSAYRRRATNAGFRGRWVGAIGSAYQRLELALIERALIGTEKIIKRKDGSEERVREYPNAIALTLLRLHRDTAQEASIEEPPHDMDEIRERLLQKIERLSALEAAGEPGDEE